MCGMRFSDLSTRGRRHRGMGVGVNSSVRESVADVTIEIDAFGVGFKQGRVDCIRYIEVAVNGMAASKFEPKHPTARN